MQMFRKGRNESLQGRQCKFHISTIKALLVTLLLLYLLVHDFNNTDREPDVTSIVTDCFSQLEESVTC